MPFSSLTKYWNKLFGVAARSRRNRSGHFTLGHPRSVRLGVEQLEDRIRRGTLMSGPLRGEVWSVRFDLAEGMRPRLRFL